MFAAVLVSLLWIVPGIVGQTVRLAGDSTMAKGGGGGGTDGKLLLRVLAISMLTYCPRLGSIFGTISFFASG